MCSAVSTAWGRCRVAEVGARGAAGTSSSWPRVGAVCRPGGDERAEDEAEAIPGGPADIARSAMLCRHRTAATRLGALRASVASSGERKPICVACCGPARPKQRARRLREPAAATLAVRLQLVIRPRLTVQPIQEV